MININLSNFMGWICVMNKLERKNFMNNNKIDTISNLFEDKEIRSVWDSEKEDYFFSVVDVISALTDSSIPRNYWSYLKRKLKFEGSELHENIVQLNRRDCNKRYSKRRTSTGIKRKFKCC